jgi:hypothetical protein
MKRLFILTTLLMVTLASVRAEELTFTADAPSAVVMGETFRLSYTINTHGAR